MSALQAGARFASRWTLVIREVLLPGLSLGMFLPLLVTRDPVVFPGHLAWGLPAGILTASAFVAGMRRLLLRRGTAPECAGSIPALLTPLAWLNLGPLVFFVPVPAIPFLLAAPVLGTIFCRTVASLDEAGVPKPFLERGTLLTIFLAAFFVLFQVNIIHDAFQYLGLLVSVGSGFDLDLYREAYLLNTDRFYNPFALHSARYLGVPLLEAPFWIAGRLLALFMRLCGFFHPATGMSYPEQLMTSLASPFFGLGALLLMYLLSREFFSRRISLLATAGYWLASPLIFFTFVWNGWPHPFNTCLTALFLLIWRRTGPERSTGEYGLLGLVGGVLLLIRPTNAVLAIFPLADALLAGRRSGAAWPKRLAGPLLGLAAAAFVFSPQLTLWKAVSGSLLAGPYREVGDFFDWLHPDFSGPLFATAQHGLFAWSPLLLPATLGLWWLARRDRRTGVLMALSAFLHLLVYASWSVWWSGIGFSNRFFTELSPVFVLGLAALLERAASRPLLARAAAAVLSLFALANLFLIGEYRAGLVPYGIPAPGQVVDRPLTAAGILGRHLFDFPDRFSSLLRSQWSNESFFPELLGNALRSNLPVQGLTALLVFLAAAAGFLFLTRLLLSSKAGTRLGRPRRWALAALMMVPALHLLLLGAGRHTIPPGRFYRFDAQDQPVSRPAEDAHYQSTAPFPVVSLDLLSYLAYGHDIRQDTPVAEVAVFDREGRRFDFQVRAGLETAEQSYLRPGFTRGIQHGIERTDVVRSFPTRAYSRHLYPALVYHCTLTLPELVTVREVRVRYLHDRGELVISDLFMRDF